MRKEIIEIEAKVDEAISDIKKLFDTMVSAEEKAQKQTEELNKNVKTIGETSKKSAKGVNGIGKSIKGIGTAMKAAGIGLIISLFAQLKDIFTSNQKVADAFATIMETVSLVFNDFANVIVNTYESVSKATGGFDALGKVLGGILKIAVTPLKLGFYGIKLGIQEAQLVWEKSFFGDKNQNTINELNKNILETKLALFDVGEQAIQAGKDIGKNIVEAAGEVASFVTESIEGISEISVKGAYESAKSIVQLKKSAEIAATVQAGLVEENDRLAEQQRQIRDNDLLSISDRKKANEELLKVLEKQKIDMTAQAKLQTAAAQADYNKNKSTENYIALLEAQNNEKAIEAQIEGFLSEQKSNKIALDKEEIELINSKKEANANLSIEQKKFNAEQETNEILRLEKLRSVLEEEKLIELERLQSKINSYAEGTQYRLDAEIEYANKKQEIDNEISKNETELANKREENRQIDIANEKALQQQKISFAKNAFGAIGDILGQQTAAGKATAAASALINTYQGISNVWAEKAESGFVGAGLIQRIATTAIVAAQGFATVKNILKTKVPSGGGYSGGGGVSAPSSIPQAQIPNFNITGSSSTNQLADAISGQNKEPVKAYVVSSEVTTAQSMERNIIESAAIG